MIGRIPYGTLLAVRLFLEASSHYNYYVVGDKCWCTKFRSPSLSPSPSTSPSPTTARCKIAKCNQLNLLDSPPLPPPLPPPPSPPPPRPPPDHVPAIVDPVTTFKEEEFKHLEWDKDVAVYEDTFVPAEPPVVSEWDQNRLRTSMRKDRERQWE